jgi:hypothetical protein
VKWPLAAQFMTMPMAVLILVGAAACTAVLWWKGRGR